MKMKDKDLLNIKDERQTLQKKHFKCKVDCSPINSSVMQQYINSDFNKLR